MTAGQPLLTLVLAACAGVGTYLWFTGAVLRWRGVGRHLGAARTEVGRRAPVADVLTQAGLDGVAVGQFVTSVLGIGVGAALLSWTLFGGWLVPAVLGGLGAVIPLAMVRRRRVRRRAVAREAWPRLLEELRLQVASLGRSIPQALVEISRRAPDELRPAFEAAAREWRRSTDLDRSLDVLKAQLADPVADAVCETLLVAHEVGGRDVDRRLRDLVDDRTVDVQHRRDANAKQAGARFARRFVLVVPLGMAGVGLTIGDGRASYGTALAQLLVLVAVAATAACWWWAGRLLRLPEPDRVFVSRDERVAVAVSGPRRGRRRATTVTASAERTAEQVRG